MSPTDIRTLRVALAENRETFGARLAVSGRTVEGWEQGRHAPTGPALKILERLRRPKSGAVIGAVNDCPAGASSGKERLYETRKHA